MKIQQTLSMLSGVFRGNIFFLVLISSISSFTNAQLMSPTQLAINALESNLLMTVTEHEVSFTFQNHFLYQDTAVIIHPGAYIDPRSYAVIARKLAGWGYRLFIMKTPSELIVAGTEQSQVGSVIGTNTDITNWVLAGHSVGGVAAAQYIYENPNDTAIKGLAMWASFVNPQWPISERNDLSVISIYGNNDCLVTPEVVAQTRFSLPSNTVFKEITGANHAQFGDYGPQKDDCDAGISNLRQKNIIKKTMIHDLLFQL